MRLHGVKGMLQAKGGFKGADLSGLTLTKLDLKGFDLSRTNLCKATLSGADLTDASLEVGEGRAASARTTGPPATTT